jgi:glycosyltransferase involved in cell wall biosynthesis
MTQSNKTIAVIIPAYQAADSLPGVIKSIPDFVDAIIVVDDGSSDGTAEAARSTADPRLTVVTHQKNQGVGGAVLTGYAQAAKMGFDIFVKMDADGQMKPEHLPALLNPLLKGRAHYAKGNRFSNPASLESMPAVRRFGNIAHSFLTKLASGYWRIFDVTNGYTALLATTYRRIDISKVARNYFFETSLLIELNLIEAKISDVDMPPVYEGEKSHIRMHHIAAHFPGLLLKGLWRRFYLRYLLRDFNALSLCVIVGFPLFTFGIAYGLSLWIFPPSRGNPTPAGTVMLAALPIIIGFQLVLTALILDVVFTPNREPRDEP